MMYYGLTIKFVQKYIKLSNIMLKSICELDIVVIMPISNHTVNKKSRWSYTGCTVTLPIRTVAVA